MDMINNQIYREQHRVEEEPDFDDFDDSFFDDGWFNPIANEEVKQSVETVGAERSKNDAKIYAHNTIAKSDLVNRTGVATHMLDQAIIDTYKNIAGDMNKDPLCMYANGCLCSRDGAVVYIRKQSAADAEALAAAAKDANSNVYSDNEVTSEDLQQFASWEVTDEFYQFLAELASWKNFAKGRFEEEMARRMTE